jgi:hypothetical protein
MTELVQVDSIQCNRPHDSRHALIKGFAIGSPFFMFIPVILRIISRFWTLGGLWWDDYCHLIGAVSFSRLNYRHLDCTLLTMTETQGFYYTINSICKFT